MAFGRGDIDFDAIRPGRIVWKTDDPELTHRLRKSYTNPTPIRRVPVHIRVYAKSGELLRVDCRADSGATATIESEAPLQRALKHPLTADVLRTQFGRLGGTIYELISLDAEIADEPMAPLSVLGALRKRLLEMLEEWRDPQLERQHSNRPIVSEWRNDILVEKQTINDVQPVRLSVLCRNMRQLRDVVAFTPDLVYVDFQDIREYAVAVPIARAAGVPIYLATPRIQKPQEGPLFRFLLRAKADGILARNLAGLDYFCRLGIATIADFSLNAANEISTALLHRNGAARVTASYDLDVAQLLALAHRVPPCWLEIVVFQHMPMFHMEHCVFCAFLSPGTDRTNCGRPCDHHAVSLRDRQGMEHPLKADVGCRNTLFNAVPQSAAENVAAFRSAGIQDFRIELLDESATEIGRILKSHRDLLAGEVTGKHVWSELKATNQLGVTRGTLDPSRRLP